MTESVTLTLSTAVLTRNDTNDYGYLNANYTAFRFDNINLRLLLGDLYHKYSTFNIQLNSVFFANGQSTAPINNFLTVKLRGLKFINNGYNLISNNSASVSLGIINVNSGTNTPGLFYIPVNFNNTFTIHNGFTELVNFDIELRDVRSDILTTQGYTNGISLVNMGTVFLFTITPVK